MATAFIQPSTCAVTGDSFGDGLNRVVLKCGCVIGSVIVESIVTDTGFMECPVCEYSYSSKSKAAVLKTTDADSSIIPMQAKRCNTFWKQISALQSELDVMFEGGDPVLPSESSDSADEEGNKKPAKLLPGDEDSKLLLLSSSSSVSDSSMDDEEPDYFSFESTELFRLRKRLKNLKAKRDELVKKKADKLKAGKKSGSKWAAENSTFKVRSNGVKAAFLASRAARRMERLAAREDKEKKRKESEGAKLVVHNAEILGKNVPKKWRNANPNVVLTAAEELKAREKKGWLNEAEQELDEEEQEALKEKRRAEWKKAQGPIPRIAGSVKRNRWALRLYKQARRTHLTEQAVAAFEADGTEAAMNAAARWKARAIKHEAKTENTQVKIAASIAALKAAKKFEKAVNTEKYFADAAKLGKDELTAELAAKKAAEEAAAAAEAQRIKDEKKAAKKERRRKEAEEKGEEFDEEAEVSTDDESAEAAEAPAAEEGAVEETTEAAAPEETAEE